MSPQSDETTEFASSTSKKITYSMVGLKFFEFFLIVCCLALVDDPAMHSHIRIFISPRVIALSYVTFGSLLIYTSIHLIMVLFGDPPSWRASTIWALVAFILLVVTTALLFRDWSNTKERNYWHPNMMRLDLVMWSAVISLVLAVVYLVDLLLTLRFGIRGDLD